MSRSNTVLSTPQPAELYISLVIHTPTYQLPCIFTFYFDFVFDHGSVLLFLIYFYSDLISECRSPTRNRNLLGKITFNYPFELR